MQLNSMLDGESGAGAVTHSESEATRPPSVESGHDGNRSRRHTPEAVGRNGSIVLE